MTNYLPQPDQRWPAQQTELLQRVATLEKQIARLSPAGIAFLCTSATRPASPTTGQQVYETDTGRIMLWTGAAWLAEWDPTAYTSATRPTGWPGRLVYETDTGAVSVYTGSVWETVVATGAWITTFTPTWAQSGGSPTIGNGSVVTGYTKRGRTCEGRYQYTYGSTSTYGTGTNPWTWTLPLTPTTPAAGKFWNLGSWSALVGTSFFTGSVRLESTGVAALFVNNSTQSVHGTNPGTWISTNYLQLSFLYETTT